jgi:secreted PhoX family phosphatase
MTDLSRRTLLKGGAGAAVGLVVAGPFEGFVAHAGKGRPRRDGYGPLAPVADLRDGTVRLELPAGFRYRSFHRRGTVLDDGSVLPGRHDGMATFRGRHGRTIIVRNHEINGNLGPNGGSEPVLGVPADGYDPIAKAGTATIEVDGRGNVFNAFVSLSGTQMNCAGGPTPWRTWITCEETINGADVGPDFTGVPNNTLLKHGYLFEVPARGVSRAEPIRAAGRFVHEAVAASPSGRVLYLTEDNFGFPSGFYRYLPPNRPRRDGFVADGGRLQMLAVRGIPNAELHLGQPSGARYRTRWVDIDDPDPTFAPGTTNDQAISAVGNQGRARGAALFSRLEGCVWDRDRVYFTSTQGGAGQPPVVGGFGTGRGQVWSYHPGTERLELVYEAPTNGDLDLPDNIEASRSGSLVLCEDGSGDNFLRGLTRRGEIFNFARNADATQVGQEFAGARFSPDFKTLFVNIQSSFGYSVAIWGPWHKGPFG